jgi:hypothetical protein
VDSPDAASRRPHEGGEVRTYVVERYLAGWPVEAMRGLVLRVEGARAVFAHHAVHHQESVVIPDDETCLCVFTGPDATAVWRANEAAGLPVDRVVEGEVLRR